MAVDPQCQIWSSCFLSHTVCCKLQGATVVAMAVKANGHLRDGPIWLITMVTALVVSPWDQISLPPHQNITGNRGAGAMLLVANSNQSVWSCCACASVGFRYMAGVWNRKNIYAESESRRRFILSLPLLRQEWCLGRCRCGEEQRLY